MFVWVIVLKCDEFWIIYIRFDYLRIIEERNCWSFVKVYLFVFFLVYWLFIKLLIFMFDLIKIILLREFIRFCVKCDDVSRIFIVI